MSVQSDTLKQKLDVFIRKYYLNRLLQGLLLTFGGLLAVFMAASVIEYFGHFGSVVRAFLLYGYLIFTLFVVGNFIFIPLLKWLHISNTISYEKKFTRCRNYFDGNCGKRPKCDL